VRQLSSAAKRVADGWLAHRQAGRGARYVPFQHDGFDYHEQVKIEPHVIHLDDNGSPKI
jgi:hypothetical protein